MLNSICVTDIRMLPISGLIIFMQRFDRNRHEVFHDTEQARAREVIKEWIFMSP